jgi:hypothetical protein
MAPASIATAAAGNASLAVEWMQSNVRMETATNDSGLRLTEQGLAEAYAPVLPPQWKSMVLRNIAFRGWRFDIVVGRDAGGRVKLARRAL